MKIETNTYVALSYDLNVGDKDEERELMEQATAEHPLEFIFGMGFMLPAFETALLGLEKGATFAFSLSPAEAYGEYLDDYISTLPKKIFEVDGKFDASIIQEGNMVPMMDADGNRLNGVVEEVREDEVVMDFNHPLAGETLHFKGKVLDVHEATAQELSKLTASGCDCGCDCGCDECDSDCK